MRLNKKITALIAVVAALFLLAACLLIINDWNTNDTEKSFDPGAVSEISVIPELSEESDDSEIDTSEEAIPSSIEVFLYNNAVQLDLQVNSSYVAAADSNGGIIFQKNTYERCYPASLTKLITAVTAERYVEEDHLFTVGDELELVKPGSSIAYLEKGDVLDFITLVDALMLPSGNDAAYVMAVGVGRAYTGDDNLSAEQALDVFADLMNSTAKDLGCKDSNFIVPDGFHDENHYTTVSDMLKIALYASELDIVMNSVGKSTARHVFYSGRDVTWENTNMLLRAGCEFYYPDAFGLKTGATNEAGRCLAAIAEKDGREVIVVTMYALSDADRYNDVISVFNAAFAGS